VKLLLAGRLTRWKGQALAIEAAAQLAAAGTRDFVLVLAGDDQGRSSYRAELEAMIAGAGLGDIVKLVGHCADMPAAYRVADIALVPSLKPEPFGRTAVEPQVMGRVVVAADHGALRETMGQAARARAMELYCAQTMGEATLAVYARVLEMHG
jgi:glycosyltransferase involved in cell wall biosynthesis